MKLRAGDILRHIEGTLYLVCYEDNANNLPVLSNYILELGTGSLLKASSWLDSVQRDGFGGHVTHTNINICDVLDKIK